MPHLRKLPEYWKPYHHGKFKASYEVETGVSLEELAEISAALVRAPQGFHVHPKIVKLLEQRAEMGAGKRLVDYGYAEALAFGSLLLNGTPVRLSGQDTQRGTFNQRHAVLVDTETERTTSRSLISPTSMRMMGLLRNLQFFALRSSLPWFRVWFLPRLS